MDVKKFLMLGILGLFLIMFTSGVVSAETLAEKITNIDFSKIGSGSGFTDPQIAKILIFILVGLIVYNILEVMSLFSKMKGLIAIIVAILSVYFLSNEEIYTIMLSYGALGITLSGILPFILMAVFNKSLLDKGHLFMSKLSWAAFAIVLFFRLIFTDKFGTFGLLTYGTLIILSIVLFIWEYQIYKIFMKEKTTMKIDKFKEELAAQNARRKAESKI